MQEGGKSTFSWLLFCKEGVQSHEKKRVHIDCQPQMQSSCHGVKASRLPRRRETPREMELGLKSSGSPLGRLGER